MKIKMILSLMLLPILASAQEPIEVNGLNYLLNEEEKTATVTSSNYEGILVIPEIIMVGEDEYTVNEIGDYAFRDNVSLLSVTIPISIKTIGKFCFLQCQNLTSIKLGDGLESIGDGAFEACYNLQSISFGKRINSIGRDAFLGYSTLNQIYINDLKQWCMIDFKNELSNPLYHAHHLYLNKKEIKELVIPEGITEIKRYAFIGGSNITSLDCPNGVTKIGSGAFYGCTTLAIIDLPESLISIGSDAFQNCSSIEELNIPDGNTEIGQSAFQNCSSMEKLKLSNNLQIIDQKAFKDCSKLRSISIPPTVELIFQNAFSFTSSDDVVFFMNPEYPPLAYENSFPSNSKFYVPDGSLEPYQNVVPWNNYELHTFSGSGPEKCAPPVITYKNETISFTSETPDAVFHYVITSADGQKNIGSSLNVSGKLLVSVYASKSGYEDSEAVESEIDVRGIRGDLNGDGIVNVADHVKLSDIIINNE